MVVENRADIMNSSTVLVLSTGYEPLFKTSWKRAVTAVVCGRAEIVEQRDGFFIKTGSGKFPFPTKVRFISGVFAGKIKKFKGKPKLSKKNLWLRDKGECQYCCRNLTIGKCTIDHVVPKSKGGSHTWENVVLSCSKCNQKKAANLLADCNMALCSIPREPDTVELKLDAKTMRRLIL